MHPAKRPAMRSLPPLFALALLAGLAAPAHAYHCPADMKQIDAALAASPKLSDAQLTEVKTLRAQGEKEHAAGKHAAAVDTLGRAKQILGI